MQDLKHLLRQTWQTIWKDKFLLVLGLVVTLGAGHGGIGGFEWTFLSSRLPSFSAPAGGSEPVIVPDMTTTIPDLQAAGVSPDTTLRLINNLLILLVVVIGLLLVVALVFGILSVLARGGIIAAVGELSDNRAANLQSALRCGWQRLWQMMVILSIPLIPVTVGVIVVVLLFTAYFGGAGVGSLGELARPLTDPGFKATTTAIMIPLVIVSLLLGFWQIFADRACVLENLKVGEAYRRGGQVLRKNLKAALPLLAIELAIRFVIGLVVSLLTITIVLRFIVPIPLLIGVLARTYLTSLWTLAWADWTAPQSEQLPSTRQQ